MRYIDFVLLLSIRKWIPFTPVAEIPQIKPTMKFPQNLVSQNINNFRLKFSVDLPANSLWQTLRDEFPEAKVILVVRDDQKWINSLQNHLVVSIYCSI